MHTRKTAGRASAFESPLLQGFLGKFLSILYSSNYINPPFFIHPNICINALLQIMKAFPFQIYRSSIHSGSAQDKVNVKMIFNAFITPVSSFEGSRWFPDHPGSWSKSLLLPRSWEIFSDQSRGNLWGKTPKRKVSKLTLAAQTHPQNNPRKCPE